MRTNLLALGLVASIGTHSSVRATGLQSPTYDDRHRINVTGEALIAVAPDRILVTLGIDTRDLNLLVAKQQNDTIAKNALAAIMGLGVPAKDIQTDQISINQRFRSTPNGTQVFDGYTVRNMFVVTLNDPARVEALISRALESGVNYLLGVEFQTSELKKYREQARALAVTAAREKADKMAAVLGEKVGSAIQINEDSRFAMPSYYSSWSGAGWGPTRLGDSALSQNVVQASGGETEGAVALGKISIRAGVSVVFELIR
jgi:uncharacterized protein YggE